MYDGGNHFPHDGKQEDVVVVKAIVGMTIIIVGTVAVRLVAVVMVQRYF